MKRIAFLLGICLLALAFLVTGAELAARTLLNAEGSVDGSAALMPMRLVWRVVAPHSFLLLHSSAAWPVVQYLLMLPGWLLFGLPGLTLVISFRPQDTEDLSYQQEQAHEDSLYLYDALATAAQKSIDRGQQDDRDPSNPDDLVPADPYFADEPMAAELMTQRDYLLEPKPADHGKNSTE